MYTETCTVFMTVFTIYLNIFVDSNFLFFLIQHYVVVLCVLVHTLCLKLQCIYVFSVNGKPYVFKFTSNTVLKTLQNYRTYTVFERNSFNSFCLNPQS